MVRWAGKLQNEIKKYRDITFVEDNFGEDQNVSLEYYNEAAFERNASKVKMNVFA